MVLANALKMRWSRADVENNKYQQYVEDKPYVWPSVLKLWNVGINVDCSVIKELVKKPIKSLLVENHATNKDQIANIYAHNFVTLISNVMIFHAKLRYLSNVNVVIVRPWLFVEHIKSTKQRRPLSATKNVKIWRGSICSIETKKYIILEIWFSLLSETILSFRTLKQSYKSSSFTPNKISLKYSINSKTTSLNCFLPISSKITIIWILISTVGWNTQLSLWCKEMTQWYQSQFWVNTSNWYQVEKSSKIIFLLSLLFPLTWNKKTKAASSSNLLKTLFINFTAKGLVDTFHFISGQGKLDKQPFFSLKMNFRQLISNAQLISPNQRNKSLKKKSWKFRRKLNKKNLKRKKIRLK